MPWDAPPKYRSPIELRGYVLLGAQLRRRREQLGLSQRQLAALSRIDQSVISRTENGKQFGFRWSRFARLVGVLGGFGAEPASKGAPVNAYLPHSMQLMGLILKLDPLDPSSWPDPRSMPDFDYHAPALKERWRPGMPYPRLKSGLDGDAAD